MTIINGVEIDDVDYPINETANTIQNNNPIDQILHVIAVVSNPCQYATRYILAKQFIKRMEKTNNVKLYIVELAYGDQKHRITDSLNPQHLQLKTDTDQIVWHKENLINIGIKRLLPTDWQAVAWIDADIEFENVSWALDTLKILNGYKDIVQLFSHAIDMDKQKYTMHIFTSFGHQYETRKKYIQGGSLDYWHPGFAWACNRRAYEKMGGLYENSVVGSADYNMALSLVGWGRKSLSEKYTKECIDDLLEFEQRAKNLRIGYTPGVIKHHYHGKKVNRKYRERWEIIARNKFDPKKHLSRNKDGLIIFSDECPTEFKQDIIEYFKGRKEDE